MTQRILALAGVFQATELVHQAGHHGTWSGYAATTCLESLFQLEADSPEQVFGGRQRLRLGLETLLGILSGQQQQPETIQHVAGLLQLQRRFMRDAAMQERVGTELERIGRAGVDLEEHERQDLQAQQVAGLYSETISCLSPRIVVHGRPQHLQNPRTVNWIRTLLFAGLRSAVLWQQLGGGRFSLLLGRKKAIEEASEFLSG